MSTVTPPSLADILVLNSKLSALSLNCHHIGTVQNFYPTTQTADVTINYKKSILQLDSRTGLSTFVSVDYPALIQCPVTYLFGGNGGVTFPLVKGDQCQVLFNDRDMDNWFAGALNGDVATSRLHSFSDAFILVGPRQTGNFIPNFDAARPALRDGTGNTFVAVDTKIQLQNATKNLNTILQNLCTALESLTVNTGTGIPNPPFVTQITQVAADLGALLK